MGAWGHTNFDNDTALDFVATVEEEGIKAIKAIIDEVNRTEEDSYLDEDICSEALAAIEFVAAAQGKPAPDFPESAQASLKLIKVGLENNTHLIGRSKQAIDRIQHNSGLQELWEETDDYDAWLNVLVDLNARISS